MTGRGTLVRLTACLGLSAGLHWGALQAIGGAAAVPQGRGVPVADVMAARVVWALPDPGDTNLVGAVPATATAATAATAATGATGATAATAAAPAGSAASRPGAIEPAGARRATASRPAAFGVQTVSQPLSAHATSVRSGPGADSQPRPFEIWELDRAPEFLYPPLELDALPAQVQRSIDAVVSLFIDARGYLTGLEVRDEAGAPVPVDLVEAIRGAFEPVSFMPGTRDGHPVPAVQRFEMRIDPKAPLQLGFRLAN